MVWHAAVTNQNKDQEVGAVALSQGFALMHCSQWLPLGHPGRSPVSVACEVGKAALLVALLFMETAELNVFSKSHHT